MKIERTTSKKMYGVCIHQSYLIDLSASMYCAMIILLAFHGKPSLLDAIIAFLVK